MASAASGQLVPWFERKFEFSFPIELLPNVCVRLRGAPPRLIDLLRGRDEASLLQTKRDGSWSVKQNLGHLLDLEPLWLARVHDFNSGNAHLTVADLQNLKTERADHNARPASSLLDDFRRGRAQLLRAAESADAAALGRHLLHPRMHVPMRLIDHLHFVAEHDDHHMARIWSLLAEADDAR